MKEELENLGIELAKLAKKYEQDYLTLNYTEGTVLGNEDPEKDKYMSIHLDKEEVEKRCSLQK